MNDPQLAGHLALPAAGSGRGVLVLHPWWGLSSAVRGLCDRLAEAGFTAYAPDLYHGKIAATIPEAEALSGQLDPEGAMSDIAAAVSLLAQRAAPGSLGVIGLSLGAFYALRLSAAEPERIRAVVLYYGTGDGEFSRAQAAYLGHFAENDPYESAEWVNWLEGALREAGRPVTFHHYPGTGHWFCEPDRPGPPSRSCERAFVYIIRSSLGANDLPPAADRMEARCAQKRLPCWSC